MRSVEEQIQAYTSVADREPTADDKEMLRDLLYEAEQRGFEKKTSNTSAVEQLEQMPFMFPDGKLPEPVPENPEIKPRKGIDKKQIERIIMGQIKHTLNEHPEFFTEIGKNRLNSISKRIAGDVNAYVSNISASAKRANGE